MKIRCDLHLNGGHKRLVLAAQQSETLAHLALKLSGYLLFWGQDPKVGLSARHPALAGQEFLPDLAGLDDMGGIALWVECGKVALHKLNKVTRRYPTARLVVLKESEQEARRLRKDLIEQVDRQSQIEIWAWRADDFNAWTSALKDDTHVVGEAAGRSLNLVMNENAICADLIAV